MKRKTNNNVVLGRVEEIIPTTLHKLELTSLFLNEYFCNIIFLCTEKGYVYAKELRNLLCIDPRYYINKLVKLRILEQFDLTKTQLNRLKHIKGLNDMNILLLKTYRFTNNVKVLIQNPEIYSLLCEYADLDIKKYCEYLNNLYDDKVAAMQQEKQKEHDLMMLRYKIAKSKSNHFRTGDDWALIQLIENNN